MSVVIGSLSPAPAAPDTSQASQGQAPPAVPEGTFRNLLEAMCGAGRPQTAEGQPLRTPPATGTLPDGEEHPAKATAPEADPRGVPFAAGLARPIGKGGVPAALAALLTPPPETLLPTDPLPSDPLPEEPGPAPVVPQVPLPEMVVPLPVVPLPEQPLPEDAPEEALVISALNAAPVLQAPVVIEEELDTPTRSTIGDVTESEDPGLEAFARQATALVSETPLPPGKEGRKTFGDLVRLAAETAKEQGGRPERPEVPDTPATEVAAPTTGNATLPAHAAVNRSPQILPVKPDPGDGTEPPGKVEPKENGPQGQAVGFDKTPAADRLASVDEVAAPAPDQPAHSDQVVRQTVKFIKLMVDAKQSEVRLNLHPEHLGSLAVKLVMSEGTLRANLVAQDMAAKVALESNLDQLRTRLQEQGITVAHVEVAVGSGSDFDQSRHSRQGEQGQTANQGRPHFMQELRDEESERLANGQQTAPSWSRRQTGSRFNALA